MKAIRKESGNPIVTLEDFWQYKDKAIITANKLPSTVVATTPQVAVVAPVKQPEVSKDEKILLAEAFRTANDMSFDFKI